MCRDVGGVRTLLNQLPAGSNAGHEVSHDLLFTIKLIRVWGEVILCCFFVVIHDGAVCGCRGKVTAALLRENSSSFVDKSEGLYIKIIKFN